MTSTMKTGIVTPIASTGRRRTVTQRACVAWKIIKRIVEENAIPHQYEKATRYE